MLLLFFDFKHVVDDWGGKWKMREILRWDELVICKDSGEGGNVINKDYLRKLTFWLEKFYQKFNLTKNFLEISNKFKESFFHQLNLVEYSYSHLLSITIFFFAIFNLWKNKKEILVQALQIGNIWIILSFKDS